MKIIGRKDIKATIGRYIYIDFEITKNFDNCMMLERTTRSQELYMRSVTAIRKGSG